MDTSVFNSVFWLAICTALTGFVLKLASMCYQSKCRSVKLCGGRLEIIRDIEIEEKNDAIQLSKPPLPNSPSNNGMSSL